MIHKDNPAPSDLVNEVELARRWGVSRSYLRAMRCKSTGPKFFKLGAAVRYSLADAQSWLEAQSRAA